MLENVNALFLRTINLFRGSLKDKIVFFHIPKCAGSSFTHALKQNYQTLDFRKDQSIFLLDPVATVDVDKIISSKEYPHNTNDDYSILKLREQLLLYSMSRKSVKLIAGHFTFSDLAYKTFHSSYAFITILRDPVKRYISSYFYNKYKNPRFRFKEDISEYMDSYFGQSQGFEYAKFLGGANIDGDYSSQQAVERAKKNLDKMDIVGILERLDIFCMHFKDRFGTKIRLQQRNRNPTSESYQKAIITEEINNRIKAICKPDLEIYSYAVDKWTFGD